MGQALYRQYRPKSLAEVVGQEHITETLLHALKQGKLAHAYLFTGPRGVGKTSIARILAHEVNGIPYEDDSMHLDIIEIDAASNRRIDEIRDLRDKVNIAPSSAQYKVYIIDEVHMLTREAFNALLKTLEEPPAHAIFILATTESHKLPETIISRTQRFMFKPVSQEKVVGHLRGIATAEKLDIDDEALALVAGYGGGSFRDSISLLDQTRGQDGKVTADFVRSLIGIPTDEAIESVRSAIAQHDATGLVQTLSSLQEQGFGAAQIAKQLSKRIRQDVISKQADGSAFELLQQLLEVPASHDPESFLQIILLQHALASQLPAAPTPAPTPVQMAAAATVSTAPQQPAAQAPPSKPAGQGPGLVPQAPEPPRAAASPAPSSQAEPYDAPAELGSIVAADENLWPAVLAELKKTHNTLYGIARMGRPTFYEQGLELGFVFAFHKKRVNETRNKEVIVGLLKKLSGQDIALHCIMISKDDATAPVRAVAMASNTAAEDLSDPFADDDKPPETAPPANSEALSAISNVFGSAEVLDK